MRASGLPGDAPEHWRTHLASLKGPAKLAMQRYGRKRSAKGQCLLVSRSEKDLGRAW